MLLKKKYVVDKFDPRAQGLDNQKCLLVTVVSSTFILNTVNSLGFVLKDLPFEPERPTPSDVTQRSMRHYNLVWPKYHSKLQSISLELFRIWNFLKAISWKIKIALPSDHDKKVQRKAKACTAGQAKTWCCWQLSLPSQRPKLGERREESNKKEPVHMLWEYSVWRLSSSERHSQEQGCFGLAVSHSAAPPKHLKWPTPHQPTTLSFSSISHQVTAPINDDIGHWAAKTPEDRSRQLPHRFQARPILQGHPDCFKTS